MVTPLRLRPATPQDIPALVALVNSAFRGDSSRAGWTTEADLLGGQRIDAEMLADMIQDPVKVILVSDGAPQSDRLTLRVCLYLEKIPGSQGLVRLGMLTVSPTEQGKGTGRQALGFAEEWARREWGARAMEMMVIRQREELIAWYLRQGYAMTEERRPFPYGNPKFGEPLRDDLEFVVLIKKF